LRGAVLLALLGLAAFSATASADDTVWLCKPGAQPNPCRGSLESTIYTPSGESRVENPPLARKPKIDCFYVYPTVSQQPSANSDRKVEAQQTAIAEYQAARFSRHCRVWAPMYRQRTLASINGPAAQQEAALKLAYSDIQAAWLDYLRHYNHGRGVVLIGHSQGTTMLRQLIRTQVDPLPKVRRRLVSAILLGGNMTVRKGTLSGGDFQHVPGCASRRQTGCAIAYSTFNEPPPPNSRFGRPVAANGVNPFHFPTGDGYQVLCTNPAALGSGGTAPIKSYLRSEPFPGLLGALLIEMYGGPPPSAPTPWLQPQDHYTAHCAHVANADVLMLEPVGSARKLNAAPDPTWGLHLADVNIALGDLVDLTATQARAYEAKHTAK
jgi:hypothetical protein